VGAAFAGSGCDAWVLALDRFDPDIYASRWIQHSERTPEAVAGTLDEWMRYYERERITGITWSVVTMRRAGGGRTWFRMDELAESITEPVGEHLLRCFDARELLAEKGDDALLDLRVRVASETRLEHLFAPEPEGWAPLEGRLKLTAGLPFEGPVDSHVANLVVRCDGTRPLREVLSQSAADAGVPLETLARGGLAVIRRLIEGGFLVPAGR
jgi:hypothetical protein